jgi:hypothetical protein
MSPLELILVSGQQTHLESDRGAWEYYVLWIAHAPSIVDCHFRKVRAQHSGAR